MEKQATFNELLINEVKAHPQLYDQQHRVCTDNLERNVIWEVIAQKIDGSVNGEFAKKRWLQMRDRYRKELKMSLKSAITPKWPYFLKLNWLDPYLKDAKSIKSESDSSSGDQPNLAEVGHVKKEFPALAYLSSDKDHDQQQHIQFPPLQTVNLLETLMAASRELLERQRDKMTTASKKMTDDQQLDFPSMESAMASTSDEGGERAKDTSFEDCAIQKELEEEEDVEMTDQNRGDKISSIAELFSQRYGSSQHFLAQNSPVHAPHMDIVSMLSSPNRSHVASPRTANNHSPQQGSRLRSRNQAPYLVRRGMKQQMRGRPQSETDLSRRKFDLDSIFPHPNEEQPPMVEQFPTAEEWARLDLEEDEDLLFARLVVARLKKFDAKKRGEIRLAIHHLLDGGHEVG